jgi:hypothetical protein
MKVSDIWGIQSEGKEVYLYKDKISFNQLDYIPYTHIEDVRYENEIIVSYSGYRSSKSRYESLVEKIKIEYYLLIKKKIYNNLLITT